MKKKISSFFVETINELNKILDDRDIPYENIISITQGRVYGYDIFYITKGNSHS